METYTRSRYPQQIPQGGKIQNGDTRSNKDLPPDRGVGNAHRLQGHLLPHTNCKPVQEDSKISCTGANIPVQSSGIWSVHSTDGVHYSGQRGHTDGFAEGYKDPPVHRRLVGPGQIPPNLSPTYTNSGSSLSGYRLASEQGEIRAEPQTSFRLHRLPVRPERGQQVRPTLDWWQTLTEKIQDLLTGPTYPVQQLMSLEGELTDTEKQVQLDST